MNTDLMFSSKTDLWSTPQKLFDSLNNEFHFTLDVCANNENYKCKEYFSEQQNGLKQVWSGVCWMNPPYGRGMYEWIKKAFDSCQQGTTVVCLLPARTDTKWFHEFIYKKYEVRFIKGRVKFGNSVNAAPFPSMIVIFDHII